MIRVQSFHAARKSAGFDFSRTNCLQVRSCSTLCEHVVKQRGVNFTVSFLKTGS